MRYFNAGTNIIGVPKKMVFYDNSDEPHLLNTLTRKNHIASHYGHNALEFENKNGNIIKTITKGEYVNYKKKVNKQNKAVKQAEKAIVDVLNAEQQIKKRGRPVGSKNKPKIVCAMSDGAPLAIQQPQTLLEKRGLAPLTLRMRGRPKKKTRFRP